MDFILKYILFYYLLYGEEWADVRSNGFFGSAYKFNGKEKDDETGYKKIIRYTTEEIIK